MGMTVRISQKTHETLRDLAEQEHESMQTVLDKAIEEYRRTCFFADVNRAYAELQKDEEAWEELQAETAAWDSTLADGLPEGESWGEGGEPVTHREPKLG